VAVLIPAIVALVQFETLTPFLIIIFGCGAIQFVVGSILEPSFTGRSLNLSPLMVILALTYWTTLWGLAGALMSVPITVSVMIIFANIPAARPLAILMSGDGKLPGDQAQG
jgi:AI-2 transport protein TqsA